MATEPSHPVAQETGSRTHDAATSDKSEESKVYLSPSGNLLVCVGEKKSTKSFVVSSYAMCLASPVWRAMLDPSGHFQEASKSEVHFGDDDASSLLLILRIVHFQFPMVPQVISFDNLYNLSILCDKYDIVTLIRPWLLQWVLGAKKSVSEDSRKGQWLFIAWVFGETDMFERIIRNLALKCTVSAGSEEAVFSSGEVNAVDSYIPSLDCEHPRQTA